MVPGSTGACGGEFYKRKARKRGLDSASLNGLDTSCRPLFENSALPSRKLAAILNEVTEFHKVSSK